MREQYAGRPVLLQWLTNAIKTETDECMLWPFAKDAKGYGFLRLDYKTQRITRLVMKMVDPAFTETDHALHTCDNPTCFNPRHLFKGDQSTNMLDMYQKGRESKHGPKKHPRGMRHGLTTLTDDQVREIRRRRAAGEMGKDLALEFGVHKMTISRIHRRVHWGHLED